jgi:O-antigen ligase
LTETRSYITGVGYENFRIEYVSFTGGKLRSPHNAYLKSLLELGLLGFALFMIVVIYPLKYGLSVIKSSVTKAEQSLTIALLWSYAGILVFALFQPVRSHFQFYLLSAILFGALSEATNT